MSLNIDLFIQENTFYVDIDPFKDKNELFDKCAEWLLDSKIINDKDKFKELLFGRESIGPTYMGNLMALPHAKGSCILKPTILFCRTKTPFAYQSHDEAGDVKYVFMLAIPDEASNENYMKILAGLASALTKDEFLKKLDDFQTCKDFVNCFLEVG